MKNLGNVFSLLAAVVAIAAAILSFVISSRRAEFKGRADTLATAVAAMAKSMDDEGKSGTSVASSADFTPANAEAGTPESGGLSWKAYHEAKDESGTYAAFQDTVAKVVKQAGDLTQQRNDLSEALAEVAIQLAIPEDELDPADLTALADLDAFEKATRSVRGHATAVALRDKALIATLVKASDELGHPIDREGLTTRETTTDEDGNTTLGDFKYGSALDAFSRELAGLKTRSDEYAQAIVDGIGRVTKHEWEADPMKLRDEREYAGVLTSLLNDFDDINEKLALYDKAKIEVAEQKQKIGDLEEDLDQMRVDFQKTQDELAKTKQIVARLKRDTPSLVADVATGGAGGVDPNLKGEVLSVNDEWNYVIIDLGSRQVRENMQMLIARQDRLVAKVNISRVHSKISIGEILPEANTGSVRVGDRVILSAMQAN